MKGIYDCIVIGAAQAGLSIGYELQQLNQNFLLLDKESEIGASWLQRWDSLQLFTPTEFNHLKGLAFPAEKGHYPDKYEVADYFKLYVDTFKLPVQLNTFVEHIDKKEGVFKIETDKGEYYSYRVVVATGPFHIPYTPRFSEKISKAIQQSHSNYYQSPNKLKKGATMVVGAGDSGFQIVDEISSHTTHKVYFAGNTKVSTLPQEILGKTLWWWFTKLGYLSFSRNSWLGKYISNGKQPIIGTDVKNILKKENVIPVGKCLDADEEVIVTEKNELTDVVNIIWATGYRPNFNWIEGLELDKDGYPKHHRGISNIKGLYFIGLPWLHTRGSATLGGIKKDACYLGEYIKNQLTQQQYQNQNSVKSS